METPHKKKQLTFFSLGNDGIRIQRFASPDFVESGDPEPKLLTFLQVLHVDLGDVGVSNGDFRPHVLLGADLDLVGRDRGAAIFSGRLPVHGEACRQHRAEADWTHGPVRRH